MNKLFNHRKIDFIQFAKTHLYNSADSNTKLSVTVALGIFSSILPVWGFQSIVAISLAIVFRLNKLIIYAVSNISQPPVTPVIIFLSYLLGGVMIHHGNTTISFSSEFNIENVKPYFFQYVIGSITLAIISALLAGAITYCLLFFLRKKRAKVLTDEEQVQCT